MEFATQARQRMVSRVANGQGRGRIKMRCFYLLELGDARNGSSALLCEEMFSMRSMRIHCDLLQLNMDRYTGVCWPRAHVMYLFSGGML